MAPSVRPFLLALPLVFSMAACTQPADVGETCTDTSDCMAGLSCIQPSALSDAPTVCMEDCDLTMTRLCEGGEVCTMVPSPGRPANLGVCLLGGTTAVGAACTASADCVAGAICVSAGGAQSCFRACTAGTCAATEMCVPLVDMGTNGFCQPMTAP